MVAGRAGPGRILKFGFFFPFFFFFDVVVCFKEI